MTTNFNRQLLYHFRFNNNTIKCFRIARTAAIILYEAVIFLGLNDVSNAGELGIWAQFDLLPFSGLTR
ncbi:hypothetical protein F5B18DRAFT_652495 [Nemania serpens]|nr:hypothetical protein F5B18DRAFT_652495 [Nemania serpens]